MTEARRNGLKFFLRWNKGFIVLVCTQVRDFPTVPAGTEWYLQL